MEKNVIEMLYCGELTLEGYIGPPSSKRKRASEEASEAEEKLRAALFEEQIDLLENYQDARNVSFTLGLQEHFVMGFSLGARILVEALRVDIPHLPEL